MSDAYQLLLPPPCFLVLDGDSPAYPALPKYLGRLSSGKAVPLARPAWSRSVVLWERVTEVRRSAVPLAGSLSKQCSSSALDSSFCFRSDAICRARDDCLGEAY